MRKQTLKNILYVLAILFVCLIGWAISFTSLERFGTEKEYLYWCNANLRGIGRAFEVYAQDYKGYLPTSSKWCDLLILQEDICEGSLVCKSSLTRRGECSYAFNKYAADKWLYNLPKQTVLLFETDYGIGTQDITKTYCYSYKIPDVNITEVNNVPTLIRNPRLNMLQWNQVGDINILSTTHHKKKGCHVLFVDGSVKFVKAEDISKLLWEPDKYSSPLKDFKAVLKSKWSKLDSTQKALFEKIWKEWDNDAKAFMINVYSKPESVYKTLSDDEKEKYTKSFPDANSVEKLTFYELAFPWIDLDNLDLADKMLFHVIDGSPERF